MSSFPPAQRTGGAKKGAWTKRKLRRLRAQRENERQNKIQARQRPERIIRLPHEL